MVRVLIGICVLWTSIVTPLRAEEADQRDARVTETRGPVTLRTADRPQEAMGLNPDTPLAAGDILDTGPESQAEITLDGETVLQVLPNSHLTLLKIFFQNTQLELKRGGMLAKVKPAANPENSLILKMPTAVVAI